MSSVGASGGDIHGTRASQHLDLIRGAAALAVLIYHVRYRFFLDYSEVEGRGPLASVTPLVVRRGS